MQAHLPSIGLPGLEDACHNVNIVALADCVCRVQDAERSRPSSHMSIDVRTCTATCQSDRAEGTTAKPIQPA